jgi:hypothetical protein
VDLKYFFHRSRLSRWQGVSLPSDPAPFSVSVFWLTWWQAAFCLQAAISKRRPDVGLIPCS